MSNHNTNIIYVESPQETDVMFKKGGDPNYHSGTKTFRKRIKENAAEYKAAVNGQEQIMICNSIVDEVKNNNGRFLGWKRNEKKWYVLGIDVAIKKMRQSFRDCEIDTEREESAATQITSTTSAEIASTLTTIPIVTPIQKHTIIRNFSTGNLGYYGGNRSSERMMNSTTDCRLPRPPLATNESFDSNSTNINNLFEHVSIADASAKRLTEIFPDQSDTSTSLTRKFKMKRHEGQYHGNGSQMSISADMSWGSSCFGVIVKSVASDEIDSTNTFLTSYDTIQFDKSNETMNLSGNTIKTFPMEGLDEPDKRHQKAPDTMLFSLDSEEDGVGMVRTGGRRNGEVPQRKVVRRGGRRNVFQPNLVTP